MPKYMNQRTFAVVDILDVILPLFGPVVSALKSLNPPMPRSGISATTSAITPMPPSQCVMHRQRFTLFGSASTFAMTEAPVVVKPLTLSNTASVIPGKLPQRQNGTDPKRHIATHTAPTSVNASKTPNCRFSACRYIQNANATTQLTDIGTTNAIVARCSPYANATANGAKRAVPTIASTYPIILDMEMYIRSPLPIIRGRQTSRSPARPPSEQL